MDKEKFIWDIAGAILDNHGDTVDNISIHEYSEYGYDDDDVTRKIYCSEGFCFMLRKVYEYEDGRAEADIVYYYSEPWEEFNRAGIDKAIEILNAFAGLKP